MNNYSLWLHWKQGDDFHSCLGEAAQNIPAALELWAKEFDNHAQHCRALAKELNNTSIECCCADVHYIEFCGDETVLDKLAEQGLLNKEEREDE